jgi:hypothetical protein
MSGFVVACARDGTSLPFTEADVRTCVDRLVPDNITAAPPLMTSTPGLVLAVFCPAPELAVHAGAVCLGGMIDPPSRWWSPDCDPPDGSYALCRCAEDVVDLVSDSLGSRTMWYVLTDDLFLASSSQRALVCLMGSFEPDAETVSWLASSGTLGLGHSWDARVRSAPPGERLRLDRRRWRLTGVPLSGPEGPELAETEATAALRAAILETCAAWRLPPKSWLLTISGGRDSRSILMAMLAAGVRPRCVTWGAPDDARVRTGDARIAAELCRLLGLEHTLIAKEISDEPQRQWLTRYLVASEGRSDQLSGYVDGLRLWKDFHDAGIAGIIRGDEPGWGYSHVTSEADIRQRARLILADDFAGTHLIRRLGLAPQSVRSDLPRRPGEQLEAYRNRLFELFMSPLYVTCLSDIKSPYVEVVNPLLARRVVSTARRLPVSQTRERRAFKAVARELSPDLPFARRHSVMQLDDYLLEPRVAAELTAELGSSAAQRCLSRPGLDAVIEALNAPPAAASLRQHARERMRERVPLKWRRALRGVPPPRLSTPTLALRLYIASRMATMLAEDAQALTSRARATA